MFNIIWILVSSKEYYNQWSILCMRAHVFTRKKIMQISNWYTILCLCVMLDDPWNWTCWLRWYTALRHFSLCECILLFLQNLFEVIKRISPKVETNLQCYFSTGLSITNPNYFPRVCRKFVIENFSKLASQVAPINVSVIWSLWQNQMTLLWMAWCKLYFRRDTPHSSRSS